MEDRNQKVVIFDDYVCEKNQNDITKYFIQGRHKNCLFVLRLNVPVNNFSVMSRRSHRFLGY